jgi:hypothetical protein
MKEGHTFDFVFAHVDEGGGRDDVGGEVVYHFEVWYQGLRGRVGFGGWQGLEVAERWW